MPKDLPRISFDDDDDGRAVRLPRMADWLIAAILLTLLVWLLAPHQLPVSVYKLSLIALAAVAGYWIDRSLFPYARPDSFLTCIVDDDDDDGAGDAGDEYGPYSATETRVDVDQPLLNAFGLAMLRRAIIVAAAMIAVGLGA